MNKNIAVRFTACAAFVFAASATLPAAELAHRWSFNGDYSDSVGGAYAVKCGTYVSLYGGRVHMGYGDCTHGTGYVDLGTNMLDTTAATIEIWARHDGVESWSRVFDYGADTANNVFLSWTFGTTLSKNQAGSKVQGAERKADYTTPYEIGVDYYIAATFEQQGDGATLVKWQRRDAATGVLLASGSLSMAGGINSFVNPVLYLGHSQYDSDRDALAAYDEVRVWRGVLTDDQLMASAAAGPDAAITVAADVPQFTPADPPEPPTQRAAVPNGGFRMMTYNIQYCYDEASMLRRGEHDHSRPHCCAYHRREPRFLLRQRGARQRGASRGDRARKAYRHAQDALAQSSPFPRRADQNRVVRPAVRELR